MIILRPITIAESIRVRRSEWGSAVCMAIFGFILLSPYNTFETSPSFFLLASWMTEPHWGEIALVIGITRLAVLIYNGSWSRSNHARAALAATTCFFWSALVIGLALTATWPTGIAPYGVFLVMDMHTIVEAMADAREMDERRHAGLA